MSSAPTYRLRLLGGASIERSDGAPVVGRAAQRHRLALLALLACAPGWTLSRDKLLALLWPESDRERGRNLLNVAVYELRKTLGEDALISGADDLRLGHAVVGADVIDFERALDRGDHEAAVELYPGPLLDGFHLADGGELERWLDAERARLAARYAAALEALAGAAEALSEFTTAGRWWRRLAAHEPYNGRVAVRLMRALEADGDRAGVLRHARVHASLLQEEFAAGPDPEVAGFAERLRLAPPTRALPESLGASVASPTAVEATAAAIFAAREPEASGDVAPSAGRGSRRWLTRAYVAAGVAAASVMLAVGWRYGVSRGGEAAPPAARSLAVLPFVNMSPDPATGYFSDGLSEQIITALSRIPGLRVAARTSSFALRDAGLDVRVIGDTLDVEAVLEGSVRREGERLRATAQLIDARTGYRLWSGEYDRQVTDALVLQDEIAGAIAAALELRLPARATPSRGRRAPDPRAYDLYLRALHLRDDMSGDAMRAAAELLDRATELDPGFALAWAEKANVMGPRINYGHVPREQGVAEMRAAVARALELDPELGEAHVALGILRLFYDWDWAGGERALRRAVALNPSDPHAWHNLGNQLNVAGRMAEAVDARLRGLALDPLNARMRGILALELMMAGRYDEAVAEYERARQLDPMNPNLLGAGPGVPIGAEIHLARGSAEDAVEELVRVAALRGATPDELDALRAAFAKDGMPGVWRAWLDMDRRLTGGAVNSLRMAMLLAFSGDVERALDWLERAHAERNPGIIFLQQHRAFAALRSHPRFARVVAAMKFPAP